MRPTALLLAAFVSTLYPTIAVADAAWQKSLLEWRERVDVNLRADNGWLTLAGRFVLKPGANTFGTAEDNSIVFPKGLGPARIGTLQVEPGKVTLRVAKGVMVEKDGMPFEERVMGTDASKRDWVSIGPVQMHVIAREDRFVLRLADNESAVRKGFGGRVWYEPKADYRVQATYVPYPPGRKITIINVIDEASDEPSPGYVEFTLGGQRHTLDAVGEGDGLFFVLRDATAGDTTYRPGRFLYVSPKPKAGERFTLDLNRIYNPPCAFSEFTTCPLPPKQNILKTRVEAGEKYPPRRAAS